MVRDFPGGPVVKNLHPNAGDVGSIPGWGTKISRATAGQLSPRTTTTELSRLKERARVLQATEPTCPEACSSQLERENLHATTGEKPARRNEQPARCNERSSVKIPCATTNTRHSQKK